MFKCIHLHRNVRCAYRKLRRPPKATFGEFYQNADSTSVVLRWGVSRGINRVVRRGRCSKEGRVATLDRYMAQYDHEHTNPWNKTLHAIGIPVIFAGAALLLMQRWQLGVALLVLGWLFLFAGHRIEGNKPAFFRGPIYFLIGPVWVFKEVKDGLLGRSRRAPMPR